jgi:hypothetical protein
MAQSPSGIPSTNNSVQSISRQAKYEPFDLQVSRNQISGHQQVAVFGYSASIGNTSTPQTIWEGANNATQNNYTYLSTASQLTLVSTNASDTGVVFVSGLDSNFNLLSETITLTGTSAVTTVNSYLRVNGLYYTNGTNVGTITAKVSTTTYGYINPGIGQSQSAVYTVPNGYTFYETYIQANSTLASQAVLFQTQQTYNVPTVLNLNGYSIPHNANTQQAQISPFSTGFFDIPFTTPIPFPQGTDLQWQAKTNGGGINGGVSVFIGGYLISNGS